MSKLEVLCVTMHQKDFSKIKEMNIHTDVIFANQADETSHKTLEFEDYTAQMITTTTRGVGINRNVALMYASAEYCMLADDDVVYDDDMPTRIINEFESHPDADLIIFHLKSDDPVRIVKSYEKTKKWHKFKGLPWGGYRIAVRLSAVRKANVWFTTLFGGGAIFPSGEDSMFLTDLRKAGLTFYVSKETIGKVSFDTSTWFSGFNENYFYGKGAFYQAVHPHLKHLWMLYMALRTHNHKEISFLKKILWMKHGVKGYKKLQDYGTYI